MSLMLEWLKALSVAAVFVGLIVYIAASCPKDDHDDET